MDFGGLAQTLRLGTRLRNRYAAQGRKCEKPIEIRGVVLCKSPRKRCSGRRESNSHGQLGRSEADSIRRCFYCRWMAGFRFLPASIPLYQNRHGRSGTLERCRPPRNYWNSPIGLGAFGYAGDGDRDNFVLDFVDHPVVADTNTVGFIAIDQFARPHRTWVFRQTTQRLKNRVHGAVRRFAPFAFPRTATPKRDRRTSFCPVRWTRFPHG